MTTAKRTYISLKFTTMYGNVRQYMAIYGNVQQCTTMYDNVQQYTAICGNLGQSGTIMTCTVTGRKEGKEKSAYMDI